MPFGEQAEFGLHEEVAVIANRSWGHRWTFSQSIADVDPASWGATSIDIG